jgi:protein-tyrosine phosphatase
MDMNAIDIHTHILFGIDDGARDIETTKQMLNLAKKSGTSAVFVTPHTKDGAFDFEKANAAMRELIKDGKPEIQIYTGCEIMYTDSVTDSLKSGKLPTLAGSRYVLCEFLPNQPYSDLERAVTALCKSGYLPIIAHAERYACLDINNVRKLYDSGAYIQLNARSVAGKNGFKIKSHCKKLILAGLVHFIASDAHSMNTRVPVLIDAYEYVSKKFGSATASEIFYNNPIQIINNTII